MYFLFFQQVEAVTHRADSTPLTGHQGSPKHNLSNQGGPQQEPITVTTAESMVKGSTDRKGSPSDQDSQSGRLQCSNLRLMESLKEKAGFPHDSHKHPPPTKPANPVSKGVAPAAAVVDEDSNKITPTEKPSALSTTTAATGGGTGVQDVLYATRERRMQRSAPSWSEQKTVGDTGKSGNTRLTSSHFAALS